MKTKIILLIALILTACVILFAACSKPANQGDTPREISNETPELTAGEPDELTAGETPKPSSPAPFPKLDVYNESALINLYHGQDNDEVYWETTGKTYWETAEKYFSQATAIGDGTETYLVESNYDQYASFEKPEAVKYTDKINIKAAVLNSVFYNFPGENYLENQYTKFVVEEDYLHYQDVDPDFYFEITGMMLINGNDIDSASWGNSSRAKKIKVTFNGEESHEYTLTDTADWQTVDVNYKQNSIEKPISIDIEVLETYEGTESEDVYITDIRFGIASNIPQGR